jgi:hypothetical protein
MSGPEIINYLWPMRKRPVLNNDKLRLLFENAMYTFGMIPFLRDYASVKNAVLGKYNNLRNYKKFFQFNFQ